MHIYTHPACFLHTPPPNAELASKRLNVVMAALHAERFRGLTWHEPPALAKEDLYTIHTPDYVANVLQPIEPGEKRYFTSDTLAVAGTGEAALHAAGAVMAATDDVMNGKADKAFCIVSPGGHHAEANAAGGFCFFNHVALAAIVAQKKWGAKRIAVVDFDAHHGNGTQGFFWNFEDRLFISLHENSGLSGFADETGAWNNIVNIPLPKNSSGEIMRASFMEKAVPKLNDFKPDIIFVSAGFDMHAEDPMSSLCLNGADYFWLGQQLGESADTLCDGRLVAVLEGGYNVEFLGDCVATFIDGLMN
ncbi:MAG: histone deacetylase family protein [Bdellovibrionales bacterium]